MNRAIGSIVGFLAPWLLVIFVTSVAQMRIYGPAEWTEFGRGFVCVIALLCALFGAAIADEIA